ncbi:MAG: apolipoprotein N-acyltransferase [Pseudomonadota bacterium]
MRDDATEAGAATDEAQGDAPGIRPAEKPKRPPPPAGPDFTPVRRFVEHPWKGPGLAFLLGAVAALGHVPVSWPWLAMLAFALAIGLFTMEIGWWRAAWRGLAMGTGFFAVSWFWIVEPFFVDPPRHGWMAPFALLFLSAGMALYWALAFGLAAALGRWAGGGQKARAIWLVALLTGAEMLRSILFTGFPWALIGQIWVDWPQMQGAALFGADGLTLVTLTAAALPTLFGARRMVLGGIAGAALAALPGLYTALRVPGGPPALAEPAQIVRIIQPNAAQHLKWRPDMIDVFWQRMLDQTAAEGELGAPDVVIWPETAVPYLLQNAQGPFQQISASAGEAMVALGIQRRDDAGRWYNSLAVLSPAGEVTEVYDKHHLVPFGEFMPFAGLFARLGIFGLAANDTGGYARGPGPRLVALGQAGLALPLICYEAIFSRDIARAPARPDWLMNVTNDAWFGQISGPYQHLAQSQLRAVETGLPVLRSANTGVSAVIDPYGRILQALPLGEAGIIDSPLPSALPPTMFARWGTLPVLVALSFLVTWATALGVTRGLAGPRNRA